MEQVGAYKENSDASLHISASYGEVTNPQSTIFDYVDPIAFNEEYGRDDVVDSSQAKRKIRYIEDLNLPKDPTQSAWYVIEKLRLSMCAEGNFPLNATDARMYLNHPPILGQPGFMVGYKEVMGSSRGNDQHMLIIPIAKERIERTQGEYESQENVVSITIPTLSLVWDIYDLMATINKAKDTEGNPICTIYSTSSSSRSFRDLSPNNQGILRQKYGSGSNMCVGYQEYSTRPIPMSISLGKCGYIAGDASAELDYMVFKDSVMSDGDIQRLLELLYTLDLLSFDRSALYKQLKQVLLIP